jgi:hypothetical protein
MSLRSRCNELVRACARGVCVCVCIHTSAYRELCASPIKSSAGVQSVPLPHVPSASAVMYVCARHLCCPHVLRAYLLIVRNKDVFADCSQQRCICWLFATKTHTHDLWLHCTCTVSAIPKFNLRFDWHVIFFDEFAGKGVRCSALPDHVQLHTDRFREIRSHSSLGACTCIHTYIHTQWHKHGSSHSTQLFVCSTWDVILNIFQQRACVRVSKVKHPCARTTRKCSVLFLSPPVYACVCVCESLTRLCMHTRWQVVLLSSGNQEITINAAGALENMGCR